MKKILTSILLLILSGCTFFANKPNIPSELTRENLLETVMQKGHHFEVVDEDKGNILTAYYLDGEDVYMTINDNWDNNWQFDYLDLSYWAHYKPELAADLPNNGETMKFYTHSVPGYQSRYGNQYQVIVQGKLELAGGESTAFVIKNKNGDIFMRYDVHLKDGKVIMVDQTNVSYILK